jgi:hypothetical protein
MHCISNHFTFLKPQISIRGSTTLEVHSSSISIPTTELPIEQTMATEKFLQLVLVA